MTATVTIFPEHRGMVVDTDDPVLLLQKIPTAFRMDDLAGAMPTSTLVGMPHGLDEVTRLAYLGIEAPSPIASYYDWPRELTRAPFPFAHQIVTAGFACTFPRCYILNDIGTSKTLTALWAADYLMNEGKVRAVLVLAPLSTLERVWGDAIFMHLRHRKFSVLHGSAERRKKLLAEKRDFYIINHDGVGVVFKELMARTDIDLVIIDEIAIYRNKQTGKWKKIEEFIYPNAPRLPIPYVWGLTGKPIPNSPEDAYGQCRLVTPTTVPKYFTQWRNMVMEHHSTYVWSARPEATKIVYQAMRPAIRFKRDECLDLPGEIHQTRDVEMSTDQKRHYKEIMRQLSTEVSGGRVTAVNEGVKLSKLLQIACGCVYDTNGTPQVIDAGNRVETLMEIIDNIDEKVIVFVPFTAVTGMLHKELSKHWAFAVVTGDTPVKERNQIFADFQDPAKRVDIIAHPGCMAHGLTLTEASTIIWYAPVSSNDTYEQANGRITRPGQKYTANIIHLAGSPVERKMYARLEERQSAQGLLLALVESERQ